MFRKGTSIISTIAAILLTCSAHADIIGISGSISDGPAAVGFQEFIPGTNPRAKHDLDTLRIFSQKFNAMPKQWDMAIEITREATDMGDSLIALDHFVFNNTGLSWDSFSLELGMYDDQGDFMSPIPGLRYLFDPAPLNEGAIFTSGPTYDNPPLGNDSLLKWVGGSLAPRLDTSFWFGIVIPDDKFIIDSDNNDIEIARIVLRQRVPEPGTVAMLGLGALLLAGMRRKHRR